jgi:hypothetical protein
VRQYTKSDLSVLYSKRSHLNQTKVQKRDPETPTVKAGKFLKQDEAPKSPISLCLNSYMFFVSIQSSVCAYSVLKEKYLLHTGLTHFSKFSGFKRSLLIRWQNHSICLQSIHIAATCPNILSNMCTRRTEDFTCQVCAPTFFTLAWRYDAKVLKVFCL